MLLLLGQFWKENKKKRVFFSFYFGCHFNLPVVLHWAGEERSILSLSLPFEVCSCAFSTLTPMVMEVCMYAAVCQNAILPGKVTRSKIP